MYIQIFKAISFRIEYDEQSTKDFATYCRDKYDQNNSTLNIIDKLE
jgi:hypothetical protein